MAQNDCVLCVDSDRLQKSENKSKTPSLFLPSHTECTHIKSSSSIVHLNSNLIFSIDYTNQKRFFKRQFGTSNTTKCLCTNKKKWNKKWNLLDFNLNSPTNRYYYYIDFNTRQQSRNKIARRSQIHCEKNETLNVLNSFWPFKNVSQRIERVDCVVWHQKRIVEILERCLRCLLKYLNERLSSESQYLSIPTQNFT